MLYAIAAGFALAASAPWLYRAVGRHAGWVTALLPASLFVYFAAHLPAIMGGARILERRDWVPGLGIHLSFMLDGLSMLFALLVTGIGAFILVYAASYLAGHRDLARFYVAMLAFMASMLGVVLADNLVTLFVFWELTSVTSYLLIGFDHEDAKARKSALQGLFVTGGGGLALLAGFILLGQAGGSYEISELLGRGDLLRGHPLYAGMLACVLLGAFTKSAQAPFHFWLPNAMAAPTPVSAYLHSATMVKAGVYLLARLTPALGGTALWSASLSVAGAATMLLGAFLAVRQHDLKRILAYSTVSALGTLTMLLGIGTAEALVAFVVFLLGHSLYKGALFMLAGIVDHETGTKDVRRLGGLRRAMPVTAVAAAVSALSLAGLPPLFGFVGKELMFEAVLGVPLRSGLFVAAAAGAAMFLSAAAGLVAVRPFFGAPAETPRPPHEAPLPLVLGPVVLSAVSLAFGLHPYLAEARLVRSAVAAAFGAPVDFHLALWHGFNTALLLSGASLAGALVIYAFWPRFVALAAPLSRLEDRFGPEALYDKAMSGIAWAAERQTRLLQNGKLSNYLLSMMLTTFGLVGYAFAARHGVLPALDLGGVRFYEFFVGAMLAVAALAALFSPTRLGAVAALGVLGFGVALIYIMFSAPDLAITQVLIETLTVILLVLVLFRLPRFASFSSPGARLRDAAVAVAGGALMTLVTLAAVHTRLAAPISGYFLENSVPRGHGRNVVNVILVDFRALDTLGEITVLGLAAVGVFSMLKLRGGKETQP